MKALFYFLSIFFIFLTIGCQQSNFDSKICQNTNYIHDAVNKTTEVIVHDIFSPVVAGRIYAYSNIACYEALRQGYPKDYKSFAGQLNGLTEIPAAPLDQKIDFNIAALQAYLTVSKALIFSEAEVEDFRQNLFNQLEEDGVPEDVFESSISYGQTVAEHILAWAKKDNYAQTRSFAKYTVSNEPGRWVPTPPAFIEGIEPNWREIRPMTLDSANQFPPMPPYAFSTDKNSDFYKSAYEVYTINDTDKENKLAIASFWDCNPYVILQQGHLMSASKKITPGGHWMGIVALACRKANSNMIETAEAYAMTSIALFDGFISCWDEKYRSNVCRPETYINQYIDPNWVPALQTPPFPEHTSGHSVISTASSLVLTHLFGENFAFEDSTEVPYGMPVRSFNSFKEAAAEAAVSRHYGGIHYRPGIEYGVEQGRKVGEHILANVVTSDKAKLGSVK
ncbi:MAG TPA: vanadium-dependent haloperoxidase [Saprospiraceae bacterium]|nr:vanadium-dependent haloperoxidase [Saprospiraceae bacterium]